MSDPQGCITCYIALQVKYSRWLKNLVDGTKNLVIVPHLTSRCLVQYSQ